MNPTTSWSDFLQSTAQAVIGTKLNVYQANNTPVSVDTLTGAHYADGKTAAVNTVAGLSPTVAGLSPTVMVIGGVAVLLLAVMLLKN